MSSSPYQNYKINLIEMFLKREKDWRMGGIVYQVFVDRFVPSLRLESKKTLYQTPRSIKTWSDLPSPGKRDTSTPYYTHELAFWGGDLQSLISKLDYLKSWGFTTLYLNPIFTAMSNHKYDTYDYETISPEYGTMEDLKQLIDNVHESNMTIMLDGVFNHMAIGSPRFQHALKHIDSPYRTWFDFNEAYKHGYRIWLGVPSLPELNLKNALVRDYLFNGPTSIVKKYLQLGIDGWRLDTAMELGYEYLYELTQAAHQTKQTSVVIGELLQYPEGWSPAMDGVMQLALRDLILEFVEGKIAGPLMGIHLQTWMQKTGIETMLKSWILLENHDLWRIKSRLKQTPLYQLAKTLQFTLPGTVNLYQGEECGMEGEGDPSNRAPMRWDLVHDQNPIVQLHRKWMALRREERALRIGDLEVLNTQRLLAYLRTTDQVQETILTVLNPTLEDIEETLVIPNGRLKSHLGWKSIMDTTMVIQSHQAFLTVRVPKQSSLVLKPIIQVVDGYSIYKNIE